jgi:hypothetical protein
VSAKLALMRRNGLTLAAFAGIAAMLGASLERLKLRSEVFEKRLGQSQR